MVHGFDSISTVQFPAIVLLTRFRYFFFWLLVNHFCLICVHLMLVYHAVQLSHPWSDFSRLLIGTDASYVLHIIYSQFITFEQVMLCSAYCTWFIALLASLYVVLLPTCSYLFLAQFDSLVYIRI